MIFVKKKVCFEVPTSNIKIVTLHASDVVSCHSLLRVGKDLAKLGRSTSKKVFSVNRNGSLRHVPASRM